ncbi:2551_t:CDS:2 [Paraglomus brasilianum]|uniref:60S ribosomal export protein NMD3 n=1 Tax=Paraglomus brasilianum TaxID=144538 RepID=A0A9N9AQV6_9GLOM|nr:2551_t:CDS:2 [Paraglomus brasilianum]
MCINCIRNEYDITEGIPKQSVLHFCRKCERYLQPPNLWISAQLESRELLSLCLKRLKGLNKVRLIDAVFIWTEPHSQRIKVKLTIQKEIHASTILQQAFEVEYIVSNQQCGDCTKVMAQNTWQSIVQVRQKVNHKKTFFYLEQLILKHSMHKDTINIKELKDGLDFFYSQRAHAIKMVEFLTSVIPVRMKTSEQLISTDIHSNTSNYKFTYSVEIIPICKDDLICLPSKTAKSLGNISPLVFCYRVANSINVMDANTLTTADVPTAVYWRTPFSSLASSKDLIQYYVLDVEPIRTKGKYVLADIQVARLSDFGRNDTVFFARSHLGAILKAGDTVLGYDIASSNFNDFAFDSLERSSLPDVILIKKAYPNRRRKNKPRNWKLNKLDKEAGDGGIRRGDVDKDNVDYEMFLRDLEEDPELRQSVNLYKNKKLKTEMEIDGAEADEEEEADFPEVRLDELMEDLTIQDDDVAESY